MNQAMAIVRELHPRKSGAPVAPPAKGKILGVEDIQALMPQRNGKPVSRWWVNHSFAPEYKHRTGRTVWWWEHDALTWLNAQKVKVAG